MCTLRTRACRQRAPVIAAPARAAAALVLVGVAAGTGGSRPADGGGQSALTGASGRHVARDFAGVEAGAAADAAAPRAARASRTEPANAGADGGGGRQQPTAVAARGAVSGGNTAGGRAGGVAAASPAGAGLERSAASVARRLGRELEATQRPGAAAGTALSMARRELRQRARRRLTAEASDLMPALPEMEPGGDGAWAAFLDRMTPALKQSARRLLTGAAGMAAAETGLAAGNAPGSFASVADQSARNLLTAAVDAGEAAANASGLPFLGRLEVSHTLGTRGKPTWRILTTQELWASAGQHHTVMAQVSYAHREARDTGNAGLAYRYLTPDEKHLFGVNAFYDHQWPYEHARASVGVSYRNSLIDAHLNRYIALTGWRAGARRGYQERPLSGVDLEIGGRLPPAPDVRLAARFYRWERKATPVVNPDGSDIAGHEYSMEWTPFPAFTWRAELNKENSRDAVLRSTLRFNYDFGAPLDEQLRDTGDDSLAPVKDLRLAKVRRQNRIRVQERQNPDKTATVTNTVGANTVTPPEGSAEPLNNGDAIAFGSVIAVAAGGGNIARLQYGDGATLRLGQGSTAKLKKQNVVLQSGTAQYVSGSINRTLTAPGETVPLTGTDVDLRAEGGDTTLRVRDGAAEITDPSGTTSLATGEVALAAQSDGVPPQKLTGSDPEAQSHARTVHDDVHLPGEAVTDRKAAPYVPDPVTASGDFKTGNTLTFAVPFTKRVDVTGTPELDFTLAGNSRTATYSGGSGSKQLTFTYTVQASDPNTPGINVTALRRNGASVTGGGGKRALLSVTGGTTDNVNTDVPRVASLTPPASGTHGAGTALDTTVTFSKAVTVNTSGGTPQLDLEGGGQTIAADYVSGSGTTDLTFRYTVSEGDIDLDGIRAADLRTGGGTLTGPGGGAADLATFTAQTFGSVNVDAPSLKLDFTGLTTGSDGLNQAVKRGGVDLASGFSRSSIATYRDDSGTIQVASAGEPRFDHDKNGNPRGLLIEGERTNNMLSSSALDHADWSKEGGVSINPNSANAPDGTSSAELVDFGGSATGNDLRQTVAVQADTTYTFSMWIALKQDNGPELTNSIEFPKGSNTSARDIFPELTGTIQRITGTFTTGPGQTNVNIGIRCNRDATLAIWGAQLEKGKLATSYIPTDGSPVTRKADDLRVTDTTWYNGSQSTMYVKAQYINNNYGYTYGRQGSALFRFRRDGVSDFDNQWVVGHFDAINEMSSTLRDRDGTGFDKANFQVPVDVGSSKFKSTSSFDQSEYSLHVNGSGKFNGTGPSGDIEFNKLFIGRAYNGSDMFGYITDMKYYPRRASNNQLKNLTQ